MSSKANLANQGTFYFSFEVNGKIFFHKRMVKNDFYTFWPNDPDYAPTI